MVIRCFEIPCNVYSFFMDFEKNHAPTKNIFTFSHNNFASADRQSLSCDSRTKVRYAL